MKQYFSSRGIPLIQDYNYRAFYDAPSGCPMVTVEAYLKWYGLEVIHLDGRGESVPFPDEENYQTMMEIGSPYLDHAPNPRHVVRWAERMGYEVDDLALEAMHGRYEMEAKNNHPKDCLRDPDLRVMT